jgi:CheY-like chemotaxis protein
MIVDDEEDLVWTLLRQVRRERPQLEVEGFSDPLAALEQIRRTPPDVLVTDVRMPKLGGIDLIIAARQTAPSIQVIVMTAFNTEHVKRAIARHGGVTLIEKPFEVSALLDLLTPPADGGGGFRGDVSLPMLPDLVQLYSLARVDGALRIVNGAGSGTLWFKSGDIVHARCGEATGVAAFFEMMRWDGGRFLLEPLAELPERTIRESVASLLIEGACLQDEESVANAAPAGAPVDELECPRVGPRIPWSVSEIRAGLPLHLPLAWIVDPAEPRDAALWAAADELLQAARPLGDGAGNGVLELVGSATGLALFWDSGEGRLAVGADLGGREALTRFRAAVAAAGGVAARAASGDLAAAR